MQPSTQTSTRNVPRSDGDDENSRDIDHDREVRTPDRIAPDVSPDARDSAQHMVLADLSFSQQAERARPSIYRLAYRVTSNHTEAEDITQETFVRAWIGYPNFDASRSFGGWVYRIACNLCLDLKRRQARRPSVSLDESSLVDAAASLMDTTFDPTRYVLALEIKERLTAEIGALPMPYRECIMLRAQGYSYEQIANLMNCPLGTIRSRVHRARAQLRRTLPGWNMV